jgi:hypothetical protein
MSMIGKWIHILDGEYGLVGQITLAVGATHFLVAMRPNGEVPPISRLMKVQFRKSEDPNNRRCDSPNSTKSNDAP